MDTLENRLQKRIHVSLYALLFLTMLLGLSVLLEGCADRGEVTREYVYYEPVHSTVDEMRGGIRLLPAQPVTAVGKIYFKLPSMRNVALSLILQKEKRLP